MRIDKSIVKAGKTDNTDRIKLRGWMDATEADFSAALGGNIVVTIEAKDIPGPAVATYTFSLDAASFDRGKYKSPKVKTADKSAPVQSFAFDTTKGTMKFSARKVDLTGLGCPISVTVQLGDYAARAAMDEDIVNGSQKTCPLSLLMGVKDALNVAQIRVKKGKTHATDSVLIKGEFAVAGAFDEGQPVVITLGPNMFTVPGEQFLLSNGVYNCKSVDSGNGIITAKLNTAKSTYVVEIKNADLFGSSNVVFGINAFGNALQAADLVTLPPEF
jgi:hypothetical protein